MIQPLAYIHPEAKIAQNVTIDPFAIIHKDVEISEGTWIGSHAVINEGARIGRNCKIFSGAVISSIPQDLKFNGEVTRTMIGDNTTIREYATISRGTEEHWKTEIGSGCLIMAYAHVAHDCRIELELPPSDEREEIVNFIRGSERGIMRGPGSNGERE